MFYDPNEPYREARRAIEAQALAHTAEAKARAAAANARSDVVTCNGCKANEQCGKWGVESCRDYRATGSCQRQVYARITLARLVVDAMNTLVQAQADAATIETILAQVRAAFVAGSPTTLSKIEAHPTTGNL